MPLECLLVSGTKNQGNSETVACCTTWGSRDATEQQHCCRVNSTRGSTQWTQNILLGSDDTEGLMLKPKLQYFGHLMWRTHSLEWCWERLKAGEGDDRGWDGWMASPTQWTWVWASSRSWWWTGKAGVLQSLGLQRVSHYWVTELNWWHTSAVRWESGDYFK